MKPRTPQDEPESIVPLGPTNYHAFLPRPEVPPERLAEAVERAVERLERLTRSYAWIALSREPPEHSACRRVGFLDHERSRTSTLADLLSDVRAYGKESAGLPLVSGGAAREAAQIFLSYVAMTRTEAWRCTARRAERPDADVDHRAPASAPGFSVPVFNLLYGRFLDTNGAAVDSLRELLRSNRSTPRTEGSEDRGKEVRPKHARPAHRRHPR